MHRFAASFSDSHFEFRYVFRNEIKTFTNHMLAVATFVLVALMRIATTSAGLTGNLVDPQQSASISPDSDEHWIVRKKFQRRSKCVSP